MDNWNGDYTVLRQHQQELLQEAENRSLSRALREGRKASREALAGGRALRGRRCVFGATQIPSERC
jgi:hypothetical protein